MIVGEPLKSILEHLLDTPIPRVIGWKRIGEDNQSSPLPSQLPKQERVTLWTLNNCPYVEQDDVTNLMRGIQNSETSPHL